MNDGVHTAHMSLETLEIAGQSTWVRESAS